MFAVYPPVLYVCLSSLSCLFLCVCFVWAMLPDLNKCMYVYVYVYVYRYLNSSAEKNSPVMYGDGDQSELSSSSLFHCRLKKH